MVFQRVVYLLVYATILFCPSLSSAQFGLSKPKSVIESEIMADGPQEQTSGTLSEQDGADMEELITKAAADPETIELVSRLKTEMSEELNELRKLSLEEILGGMKQTLDDMKLLDYLFKDPKRALEEMEKEGMIEKSHINKYKKNPKLLEMDARRGLYFQFVSLAVVGGFI